MEEIVKQVNLFEIRSVLGKIIRISEQYWQFIVKFKHPELKGKLKAVLVTIQKADFVYQDDRHQKIFLYYRKINSCWVCAVCRHLNSEGFLVTAYLTKKPKAKGKKVWPKKK